MVVEGGGDSSLLVLEATIQVWIKVKNLHSNNLQSGVLV